jgi:hypothetical protein
MTVGKSTKRFAVVLFDGAAAELKPIAALWLKQSMETAYFNCVSVEPNGNYFQMVLEHVGVDGTRSETELQIPHQFVKAIVCAADLKTIGFKGQP